MRIQSVLQCIQLRGHWDRSWTLLATLALWLGLAGTVGAQFLPATGPVGTPVNPGAATSASHGPYSVTRSGKTLTISRPGKPNYVFNAPGSASATLSYAFVGPSTVLLVTTDANVVDVRYRVDLVNMETFSLADPPVGLINRQFFVTESPNLQLRRNSDGQVLFTYISTNDSAINDTFEIDLYRTDTGAHLCGLADFNRDPSDTIAASVSGTTVNIHVDRDPFADLDSTCPLPIADLIVSPAPLDFAEILSTATATLPVTLTNSGTDDLEVSAIGTVAPFAPVGFVPFTLGPSASQAVDIRFNPAGTAASSSESLPITRNPAVGADSIAVEGSARAPEPELTVAPTNLGFGCVNVGSSPTRSFDIESTGDLPVTVNAITGPTNPAYVLTAQPGFAAGAPIPVGTSFGFDVELTPTAAGGYPDSITIASTDPDNPTRVVSLNGSGNVPAADFFIDPTVISLTYGEVEAGYRFGKGVRIVNNGDLPLSFDVEIIGDQRFGVSTDPATPGTGVSGPITITIPGNLAPCTGAGVAAEQILRIAFDATLPDGGPYSGTLRISGITGDPTPPVQPIDIALEGSVVPAKTVDVALILDRSGSMSEPMAVGGSKEAAVRSASRLFVELMRPDVGDRLALLQFNQNVDVLAPITPIDAASKAAMVSTIQAPGNLAPSGSTSIAGGLYEGIQQLNDPTKDVRAAFVVSDGKDNTPYSTPGGDVTLGTLTVPGGIGIHALALGTGANTDLGILQGIAGSTGGTAMSSGDVTGLAIFDIEKFFLQTATTILGGMTALDPVSRIQPGQEQVWQVELIPADKAVSFVLIYKNGVLPYAIDAPDGTEYPIGTPPSGFGQSVHAPPNARIVRIQLPTDEPHRYAGIWKIRVLHGGKLELTEDPTKENPSGSTRSVEAGGPVDYALAVSVFSNLRLLGYVSPQPLYLGDPITVTAVLTEEEIPILGATVDVRVRFPDAVTQRTLRLHDDGVHDDGEAGDGVYANRFTETLQEGSYQFAYHAVGESPRQGNFVRETFVGQYVTRPGRTPEDETAPGGDRDAGCCQWIKLAVLLLVLILIVLWRCCSRKHVAISSPPAAIKPD